MSLFPLRILTAIIIVTISCWSGACCAASYGIARYPVPVLNTPDSGIVFGSADSSFPKADRCGQLRQLEFIALPGTVFTITGTVPGSSGISYRVESNDYPAPVGVSLYIDSRFVELRDERPQERITTLPGREQIIAALKKTIGVPYVWGGNFPGGITGPPGAAAPANSAAQQHPLLAGVDCSGLLYQATGGCTPRNSSQLVSYGAGVAVEGQNLQKIMESLKPLDLIVWDGHLIIVLDRESVIESRLDCAHPGHGGVTVNPLKKRLAEIMRSRRPVNVWPGKGKQKGIFVVRRWLL